MGTTQVTVVYLYHQTKGDVTMNRKKHTLTRNFERSQHFFIDGVLGNPVCDSGYEVYPNTSDFLEKNGIKHFARRPFAGAIALKFTTAFDWCNNTVFSANVSKKQFKFVPGNDVAAPRLQSPAGKVWLCLKLARKVLEVGNRTKAFTLWVK
jgi:hypothetical protein